MLSSLSKKKKYIAQSSPKYGVSVIIVSVVPNQVFDLTKAFSLGDVFYPLMTVEIVNVGYSSGCVLNM